MTPEEVQGLVERLRAYNPPDRTIDEQRQIAVDIHEAATALSRLAEERDRLRDDYAHVEMDRDYFRALVIGAWPDADHVIATARMKRARSLTKAPHDKA